MAVKEKATGMVRERETWGRMGGGGGVFVKKRKKRLLHAVFLNPVAFSVSFFCRRKEPPRPTVFLLVWKVSGDRYYGGIVNRSGGGWA